MIVAALAMVPIADFTICMVRLWFWRRRVRSIREAAVREVERAGQAANRKDTEAAHLHLARFRELDELHEEELKR